MLLCRKPNAIHGHSKKPDSDEKYVANAQDLPSNKQNSNTDKETPKLRVSELLFRMHV